MTIPFHLPTQLSFSHKAIFPKPYLARIVDGTIENFVSFTTQVFSNRTQVFIWMQPEVLTANVDLLLVHGFSLPYLVDRCQVVYF